VIDKIEDAIKELTGKINDNVDSNDALKFTQAALNLANVAGVLMAHGVIKKPTK